MEDKWCVLLDPGHGGLLPITDVYPTAPDKQFQHKTGDEFHCDGWFYEGVFNRSMSRKIQNRLAGLGVATFQVAHDYLDTPLINRVRKANTIKHAFPKAIYLSIHANAFNGSARGFEIFSSPGTDDSDAIARHVYDQVESEFGAELKYRPHSSAKPDKERDFFVITKTRMPSVLIEFGFFDNIEDARLLIDEAVQDRFADAVTLGVITYFTDQFYA